MKFVTINNCESCVKSPCFKTWPEEDSEEVRVIVRNHYLCLNAGMRLHDAFEVASLARTLKLTFVIEVKHDPTEQFAHFDLWVPKDSSETEQVKLISNLLVNQAMSKGIETAQRRRANV